MGGSPKYIKTLNHMNYIFNLNIVPDSVRADISQRILDWISDEENNINDSYILNQFTYLEKVCIQQGYDLTKLPF